MNCNDIEQILGACFLYAKHNLEKIKIVIQIPTNTRGFIQVNIINYKNRQGLNPIILVVSKLNNTIQKFINCRIVQLNINLNYKIQMEIIEKQQKEQNILLTFLETEIKREKFNYNNTAI